MKCNNLKAHFNRLKSTALPNFSRNFSLDSKASAKCPLEQKSLHPTEGRKGHAEVANLMPSMKEFYS